MATDGKDGDELIVPVWVDHTGLKNMAVCQDWDKQYFNLFWFIN
jgi:hypothetical protein